MLYRSNLIIVCFFLLSFFSVSCQKSAEKANPSPPRLLFWNAECLHSMAMQFQIGEEKDIAKNIFEEAEKALSIAPFSVMDKHRIPPSGDKHDYMSQGPYWWPDSTKPDGLPYIRRDGEVNPERASFPDRQNLSKLIQSTEVLSKAYYISGEQKYAKKFTELIRTWFLDEATKMNPNLNFGQGIPGITEGRGIGIIETSRLRSIVDALALIQGAKSWTSEDELGMQNWCKAYLTWLLTSKHGQDEAIHPNNHGTWYDVQACALAIYTQQHGIATEILEMAKTRRLDAHILEDGSQPRELARTKSWNYSSMNLWGLFQLARIGSHLDIDLWYYPTPEKSKLRLATDYLLPYALEEESWPHKQITPLDPERLIPHLILIEEIFPNDTYKEKKTHMKQKYPHEGSWDCWNQ